MYNNCFGGNSCLWIILLLIIVCCCGGNGFSGFGGGCGCECRNECNPGPVCC